MWQRSPQSSPHRRRSFRRGGVKCINCLVSPHSILDQLSNGRLLDVEMKNYRCANPDFRVPMAELQTSTDYEVTLGLCALAGVEMVELMNLTPPLQFTLHWCLKVLIKQCVTHPPHEHSVRFGQKLTQHSIVIGAVSSAVSAPAFLFHR
ncbi:hypothetical protein GHT06_019348 [Daphnia sinensis]|uniref:Uncharacterized protein n=1 Tax=Daphnia sinensis TaxID=1820382 RepID=A0AAD5KJX5_9CRUS|nr:hypothetical protein GHT06_019348 [Daphnia sinensis]